MVTAIVLKGRRGLGQSGVAWQPVGLNASRTVIPGNPFCFGNPHNDSCASTRVGGTVGGAGGGFDDRFTTHVTTRTHTTTVGLADKF